MKILLFGISNVGKTTIGKILSKKLNCDFDDIDDEIKRRYGRIENFKLEYPWDYERHKEKGRILKEIIKKYEDNVIIAVSPIFYFRCFSSLLKEKDALLIELQDKPECVLERIEDLDENENPYRIEIVNEQERKYFLSEIKKDITYYKRVYAKIPYKFDMNGQDAETVAKRLIKYIEDIKNGVEVIKDDAKDETIMGFEVYKGE